MMSFIGNLLLCSVMAAIIIGFMIFSNLTFVKVLDKYKVTAKTALILFAIEIAYMVTAGLLLLGVVSVFNMF